MAGRILRISLQRITHPTLDAVLVVILLALLVGMGIVSAYDSRISFLLVVAPPLGLALIAWPEMTLGLYANAGLFKADPRLSSLARLGDMTLFFGAVLAATLAYRLIIRRKRIAWSQELGITLIFSSVVLLGLLQTPAYTYGQDKAFRFVLLTLLAFFTPYVIIKSYRSIWIFFGGWLSLAGILTLDALSRLGTGQRLSGFSGTGIGMSRTVGIAIIILFFGVLMGRTAKIWQILAGFGLSLMMLVMVGSGSRGPLLMLIVSILLTFGVSILKPGHRLRSILIVNVLAAVVLGIFSSGLIPTASMARFNTLANDADDDTSAQARVQVMEVAWYLFTTSPILGRGTGSVSAFGAGQEQVYPHNILLELAAETGLVGLSLYLTIVGMVLWRLLCNLSKQTGHDALNLTLLAMILFAILNAMVSGDLSDNRDLWLFAGLSVAATQINGEAIQ